jgi:hypothetical protein
MAIDTENKRRSVLHVLPVPDGTIGEPDRIMLVRTMYSGISVLLIVILGPYRIAAAAVFVPGTVGLVHVSGLASGELLVPGVVGAVHLPGLQAGQIVVPGAVGRITPS